MRFCEFQKKEVINVCDCKCLGNVCDLEFDEHDGCIRTIIVPGPAKFFGCVGREFELHIPWCKIVKIGPDIILVNIDEKEVQKKYSKPKKISKFFVEITKNERV